MYPHPGVVTRACSTCRSSGYGYECRVSLTEVPARVIPGKIPRELFRDQLTSKVFGHRISVLCGDCDCIFTRRSVYSMLTSLHGDVDLFTEQHICRSHETDYHPSLQPMEYNDRRCARLPEMRRQRWRPPWSTPLSAVVYQVLLNSSSSTQGGRKYDIFSISAVIYPSRVLQKLCT